MHCVERECITALKWFRAKAKTGRWGKKDRDFLESAANLAITTAINTYNPEKGASLQTHMRNRIMWDVAHELRCDPVTGNRRKLAGKFRQLPEFDTAAMGIDNRVSFIVEAKKEIERIGRRTEFALEAKRNQGDVFELTRSEISMILGVDRKNITKIIMDDMRALGVQLELFKTCSGCKNFKAYSDFQIDRHRKSGRRPKCKACQGIKSKEKLHSYYLRCTSCGEVKAKRHFHRQRNTKRGYMHACGVCANKKTADRKKAKRLALIASV